MLMPLKGRPMLSVMLVELVRRDDPAHGLLDLIEQSRGLLDARACLSAHVHQNQAGIDIGEEVLAEERQQPEGQHARRRESRP